MDWRNYLFSFHGRVNRAKMWLFYIVVWVLELAVFLSLLLVYALLLATGAVDRNSAPEGHSPAIGIAACIVIGVLILAVYYMYIAITAKRLHDRNKSAWWTMLFLVVPAALIFVPELVASVKGISDPNAPAMLVAALFALGGVALYIWGFIELYCLRGTAGENRFGADPLPPKIPAGR